MKLVAFDVDGTLRDRDIMPDTTRRAIRMLRERGIEVALCTGRSEFEMASLRRELGIDWAITCNGSHIGYRGRTVYGTAFKPEIVSAWVERAMQLGHAFLLYGSETMICNGPDNHYFRQAQQEIGFMEPVQIQSVKQVPPIYQCIMFCQAHEEQKYIGEDRDLYYIHRWRSWAVDWNPAGMNKAAGLKLLLGHLGFSPMELAVFGDGLNDMEMMELAGTGIAMGNAIEALKQKARYVTRSLHEDGIAYAVEKWICPSVDG